MPQTAGQTKRDTAAELMCNPPPALTPTAEPLASPTRLRQTEEHAAPKAGAKPIESKAEQALRNDDESQTWQAMMVGASKEKLAAGATVPTPAQPTAVSANHEETEAQVWQQMMAGAANKQRALASRSRRSPPRRPPPPTPPPGGVQFASSLIQPREFRGGEKSCEDPNCAAGNKCGVSLMAAQMMAVRPTAVAARQQETEAQTWQAMISGASQQVLRPPTAPLSGACIPPTRAQNGLSKPAPLEEKLPATCSPPRPRTAFYASSPPSPPVPGDPWQVSQRPSLAPVYQGPTSTDTPQPPSWLRARS